MANLVGQTIGQYKVIRVLGEGGMAVVYQARQESIGRDVAIKVIKPNLVDMDDFARRFEQEARTVASLSHAHILKIFDYGHHEDGVYLVMELLSGGSLDTLMKAGPISLERTAVLLDQITSALDYAHRKGIIHRDLKPENVLLDEAGNAFLTDFGLAKVLNSSTKLTQSGAALGTPAYMAPEQWRSDPLDARTDVYSLGVMLFEMLAGSVPFNGDSALSMMYLHLHEPPRGLRTQNPDIPPAVEAVVNKALAKDPADRFQSAGELATTFRAALSGQHPATAVKKTSANKPTKPISASSSGDKKRSIPVAWPAAIVVVALLVIIGAGIAISSSSRSTPTPINTAQGIDAASIATSAPTKTLDTSITQTAVAQVILTSSAVPTSTMTPTATATFTPSPTETATSAPTATIPPTTSPLPPTLAPPSPPSGATGGNPDVTSITLTGHTGPVNSVAYSPDAKYVVSGSDDGTARLWDRQTGKLIREFDGHQGAVNSVAISPDDSLVLSGGGDTAIVWDLKTGRQIRTLREHTDTITSVAFSTRGDLILTASADKTAKTWKPQTGELVHTYSDAHTQAITHAAFSVDGKYIVTTSADQTAVLWSATDGQVLHTLSGHTGPVLDAIFSPDGKYVLTGSADGTARLWKVSDGSLAQTFDNNGQAVNSVGFKPDGQEAFLAGADGLVHSWNVQTGQYVHDLTNPTGAIRSLAVGPKVPQLATALEDNTVRLWNLPGPSGPPPPGAGGPPPKP